LQTPEIKTFTRSEERPLGRVSKDEATALGQPYVA
jgi:hypothetical protein